MANRAARAVLAGAVLMACVAGAAPATKPDVKSYVGWRQVIADLPAAAKPHGARWSSLEKQMAVKWMRENLPGRLLAVRERVATVVVQQTKEPKRVRGDSETAPATITTIRVSAHEVVPVGKWSLDVTTYADFPEDAAGKLDRYRSGDSVSLVGKVWDVWASDTDNMILYATLSDCELLAK